MVDQNKRIYDGEGDQLMVDAHLEAIDRVILWADARPSKVPDPTPRIRIQWGQHLLEDLLAGRYRTLVCGVNATDNSGGIINQLAQLLPTSQWDESSITATAKRFSENGSSKIKVIRFDMDSVEVLALLRPADRDFTEDDLSQGFKIISEMINTKPDKRRPSASVSFLGARVNVLKGQDGAEPSFERVLTLMNTAGYAGDVYPAPWMWDASPIGMFARYPFPNSIDQMRSGGS